MTPRSTPATRSGQQRDSGVRLLPRATAAIALVSVAGAGAVALAAANAAATPTVPAGGLDQSAGSSLPDDLVQPDGPDQALQPPVVDPGAPQDQQPFGQPGQQPPVTSGS